MKSSKKRALFITLSVLILIIIAGIFFIENYDKNLLSNLLIPTALTSIIFSALGAFTFIYLIYQARLKGIKKIFKFNNYLVFVVILFSIFIINYLITFMPYGTLIFTLISFVLQIIIYGILIPYILLSIIIYLVLLFRNKLDRIK